MTIDDLASIVQPYTMASPERVRLLIDLGCDVPNIEGDFVECGVCNGGSAAILAYFAAQDGRNVHLFDSFEGLPCTTVEDTPSANGNTAESEVGKCVGSIDKVMEVLKLVGADLSKVYLHKGWFHKTFPHVDVPKIAMLNLDSDWYASEKMCLEKFYDSVVSGGFVYFDDFYYWPGCQKAAVEFFQKRNERQTFNKVGHSMWLQKVVYELD